MIQWFERCWSERPIEISSIRSPAEPRKSFERWWRERTESEAQGAEILALPSLSRASHSIHLDEGLVQTLKYKERVHVFNKELRMQGYLVHKKPPFHMTLQ